MLGHTGLLGAAYSLHVAIAIAVKCHRWTNARPSVYALGAIGARAKEMGYGDWPRRSQLRSPEIRSSLAFLLSPLDSFALEAGRKPSSVLRDERKSSSSSDRRHAAK